MTKKMTTLVLAAICCALLIPTTILAAQPDVLAKVGDANISKAEIFAAAAGQLAEVRQSEYEALKAALEEKIERMLIEAEAKKAGITLDEYFTTNIEAKVSDPSDEEINNFYERYKSRLKGKTIEEARASIVDRLRQMGAQQVYQAHIADLRSKAKVVTYLEPPRQKVTTGDNPAWGDKDAPVTIIEFSDYECPYCSRAENDAIAKVKEKYAGKVRIVFRDYPLPFHSNAQKAHEAAGCAREQGKFWEMHEKLFANQRALGLTQLKAYAVELSLDTDKFNSCLDTGKFAADVQKDLEEGASYGVQGTPAFFINGRFLSGAQPFSEFATIIDEELARSGS